MLGYSPWGHKELDTIDRLSLTHSMIASAFRTESDLENILEQSSTWGDFTPQGSVWKHVWLQLWASPDI